MYHRNVDVNNRGNLVQGMQDLCTIHTFFYKSNLF